MDLEVGSILTGKVTGITKFGAFVAVAPGRSGLVHISEIASSYVNDVSDFLTVGQEVTVKLIGIDDAGRINLSIKQALPPAERPPRPQQAPRPAAPRFAPRQQQRQAEEPTFEDKLKRFMQDSDNKIAGMKQYTDKRPSRRRGGGSRDDF